MKDGGRLNAAIEILTEVLDRHRPAKNVIDDWNKNNRYAGSKDRHVIRNLVLDSLRQKSSISWHMNSDVPRAVILGTYAISWKNGLEKLQSELAQGKYSPAELSETEKASISNGNSNTPPDFVKADVPEWIWPSFVSNFDSVAIEEGCALAKRPPVDMRVNTLKTTREKLLKQLSSVNVKPTPISPIGMRIETLSMNDRMAHVKSESGFKTGKFELQDESSQIASILVNAKRGEQILDYCAGGGGKTLALSAEMENKGQIFAYDSDKIRLSEIYSRLKRAGAHNVQVRPPNKNNNALLDLEGKMNRVLVDAPCSGSGVWRRRPEAKWRLSQEALDTRIFEQEIVLEEASKYVKVGGCLIYATCSILPQENEHQVYNFAENNPEFEIVSAGEVWQDRFGFDVPKPWSSDMQSITLTPASTGTDGFFLAVLVRNS